MYHTSFIHGGVDCVIPLPEFDTPKPAYIKVRSVDGNDVGEERDNELLEAASAILTKLSWKKATSKIERKAEVLNSSSGELTPKELPNGYICQPNGDHHSDTRVFSPDGGYVKNVKQIIREYIEDKEQAASSSNYVSSDGSSCLFCLQSVHSLLRIRPDVEVTDEEKRVFLGLHSKSCSRRLLGQCKYCGEHVSRAYLAEEIEKSSDAIGRVMVSRIMHQRVCPRNPAYTADCLFCNKSFTSTINSAALEQVMEHESQCPHKPQNICPFCGTSFPCAQGLTYTLKTSLEDHLSVCQVNPANTCWCSYCGRTFHSTFEASAYRQCNGHMENCRENPNNHCRVCEMKFSGDPNSVDYMDAAAVKRRQHEMLMHGVCRQDSYESNSRKPTRRHHSKVKHRAVDEENTHSKVSPFDLRVIQEKQRIEAMLRQHSSDVTKLRKALRQLQLKWHPDKHIQSDEDEAFVNEIFIFVSSYWEKFKYSFTESFILKAQQHQDAHPPKPTS